MWSGASLLLAALLASRSLAAQIEIRDPAGPPAPALAGCNTPAECLQHVRNGLARLNDTAALEQSGGDITPVAKDAVAQIQAMEGRWPQAPEVLEAKLAFFKSGLLGFSRADSEAMLQATDLTKASDEQLLVLGDASLALNRLDKDKEVLTLVFARKATLAEKFALWFALSGEGTISARGEVLKQLMKASATTPNEAAEVALKIADWELAFGSRNKDRYQELLRGVAAEHANTTAGRVAAAKLTVARMEPGAPLPPFQVETIAGKQLTDQDAAGKYLLLWFWADWWPALADDAAALQAAVSDTQGPGVLLVSVGLNWNDPKLQERMAERKLTIPGQLVDGSKDPGRFLSLAYGARAGVSEWCKLYAFDADGKLLAADVPAGKVGDVLAQARLRAASGGRRVIKRR
jgi:hypothetical protein